MVFCGHGMAMLTTFKEKKILLRPPQERPWFHAVELAAIFGAKWLFFTLCLVCIFKRFLKIRAAVHRTLNLFWKHYEIVFQFSNMCFDRFIIIFDRLEVQDKIWNNPQFFTFWRSRRRFCRSPNENISALSQPKQLFFFMPFLRTLLRGSCAQKQPKIGREHFSAT